MFYIRGLLEIEKLILMLLIDLYLDNEIRTANIMSAKRK